MRRPCTGVAIIHEYDGSRDVLENLVGVNLPWVDRADVTILEPIFPEGPTRAYLLVIDRAPQAVQRALRIA